MTGTKRLAALAAFYERALGKPADAVDPEYGFFGWRVGSAFLSVLQHSEMGAGAKDPGRVMFNFECREPSPRSTKAAAPRRTI